MLRRFVIGFLLACSVPAGFALETEAVPLPGYADYAGSGVFRYCVAGPGDSCYAANFSPLESGTLSLGLVEGEVRLLARVYNEAAYARPFKLEIGNPSLDRVTVTVSTTSGRHYSEVFGDSRPFRERAYFHRNFIMPVDLQARDTAVVAVVIAPQREAVFAPIRLVSEDFFLRTRATDYLLLSGLAGMYALYIFFMLGLYALSRNRLFLYYALIDVFVMLYCLLDTGLGFQFLWPRLPIVQQFIIPFTAFAYLIAIISFTREFFSTAIKYPRLDKVFLGFQVTAAVAFFAVLVAYGVAGVPLRVPLAGLALLFVSFGLAVIALGTVSYLQSGRREGFWFLLLFALHLVMFALVLNQRGYFGWLSIPAEAGIYRHLPLFTATPHYIFDILVLEMVIVAVIIAFRFRDVLEEYNVTRLRIEAINRNSIKAFVRGQEEERKALAERLREQVGIDLRSIQADLRAVAARYPDCAGLDGSVLQVDGVQRDLQRITADVALEWTSTGLDGLVHKVAEELRLAMPGLEVGLFIDNEVAGFTQTDQVRLNVYRILQEACNNIIRHAGASRATLTLQRHDGGLLVLVEDDGVGFDTAQAEHRRGIGLRNMATRARALHGSVAVESSPGRGTTVRLWVPSQKNAAS